MPDLKTLAFDKGNLLKCKGYSPTFISKTKKVNYDHLLSNAMKKLLPDVNGGGAAFLHYTGFSVAYNKKRKVPFFAAYNIDGNDKSDTAPRPRFRPDPRIDPACQLNFPFYDLITDFTEFEIGHMASNSEMGRGADGQLKAYQTFHFTNSAPQAEVLNSGMWQGLEKYIIKEAGSIDQNKKICVFTGPVLTSKDPDYLFDPGGFKVPLLFFKVIIFMRNKKLYSTAFVISHEKKLLEKKMISSGKKVRIVRGKEPEYFVDYPFKKVFQVNMEFLSRKTGLDFSWPGVTPMVVPKDGKQMEKIKLVGNADDAKRAIRGGHVHATMKVIDSDVTKTELYKQNYTLNMILP